jgi:hypothetical protein
MKRALVVMTLLGGLLLLGAPSTAFADDDGGKGRGEKSGDRGDRDRGDRDRGDRDRGDRDRGDRDRGDRDRGDRDRGDRGHRGDDGDHRRHRGDRDDDGDRRRGDRDRDDDRYRRHYYYDRDYYDDCYYDRGGYYGRYDRRYRYRDCGYYYGGDPYYRGGRYYRYGNGSHSTSYAANLTADQEVPQPGPSGARGTARINLDDARGQVCYTLSYEGIPKPSAGHIHRGTAGTSGPVAVNLDPAANGNQACVAGDPSVLQEIQSNPGGFYVNLHTADYPDGAIRGQLAPGGSY